ncbi:MAG: response regulator [Planctomycetaceae bacterium]|nr:response regulator [Planctomycetaceae bacterium]
MARILIADDSPIDQQLAGSLLRKHLKADVSWAKDGVEAMEQVNLHAPELVLTDMQMPNMNGLELVARLKEKHPLIPVILMTAAGSEEIAVKALAAGAASYVSKRSLAADLCDTVANVLEIANEQWTQYRVLQRQLRWETEFVVENDMKLVMGLAGHLMQGMRGMGVCDSAEEVRVGVALAEALLNAYYHGNLDVPSSLREKSSDEFYELVKQRCEQSPYRERRIRVSARYSRGHAVFSISDDGKGFDTSKLPDPTDPSGMAKPHGRGLLLMRSFMNEVRFNKSGNTVTMVKSKTNGAT